MTFILRTQRREKWAERYVNSITDNEEAKELLNNIKNILDTGVNDNEDK